MEVVKIPHIKLAKQHQHHHTLVAVEAAVVVAVPHIVTVVTVAVADVHHQVVK